VERGVPALFHTDLRQRGSHGVTGSCKWGEKGDPGKTAAYLFPLLPEQEPVDWSRIVTLNWSQILAEIRVCTIH
jgi:hypothetical protein